MGLRSLLLAGVARQLGRPHGLRGRMVGKILNRGNRTVVAAAVRAADVRPGQVVADLGFGGGVGLGLLLDGVGPSGRVVGVDYSPTMIDAARSRYADECATGRVTLHEGSMLDLPLPSGSLDALITVNTIYFIDDLAAAFTQAARVLKPGGRAVVGIGDPDSMAQIPFTAHGFRLRSFDEVVAELTAAGLGQVRQEQVGDGPGAAHLLIATRA